MTRLRTGQPVTAAELQALASEAVEADPRTLEELALAVGRKTRGSVWKALNDKAPARYVKMLADLLAETRGYGIEDEPRYILAKQDSASD